MNDNRRAACALIPVGLAALGFAAWWHERLPAGLSWKAWSIGAIGLFLTALGVWITIRKDDDFGFGFRPSRFRDAHDGSGTD